ncbi:amidinotransferase, partial [Mesorhizobium sp. M00.F.Ca.ET.158.01.1.1]
RYAVRAAWHYAPGFNPAKAASQHAVLAELVAASGAEIEWIEDRADGLSDSVFTHDPSLMTDRGALILSMSKTLRASEPSLHEETYRRLCIPILGREPRRGQG